MSEFDDLLNTEADKTGEIKYKKISFFKGLIYILISLYILCSVIYTTCIIFSIYSGFIFKSVISFFNFNYFYF